MNVFSSSNFTNRMNDIIDSACSPVIEDGNAIEEMAGHIPEYSIKAAGAAVILKILLFVQDAFISLKRIVPGLKYLFFCSYAVPECF